MAKVQPIPDGYPRVTPYLCVDGAGAAIAFYVDVLGATERMRMPAPDGKIGHAEVQIGDSVIMISDEMPEMGFIGPRTIGGTPVGLSVYVEDVDTVFDRAVKAGAKPLQAVEDQFYGDRSGQFEDPFGHRWNIATQVEDVPPDEMEKRAAEAMGGGCSRPRLQLRLPIGVDELLLEGEDLRVLGVHGSPHPVDVGAAKGLHPREVLDHPTGGPADQGLVDARDVAVYVHEHHRLGEGHGFPLEGGQQVLVTGPLARWPLEGGIGLHGQHHGHTAVGAGPLECLGQPLEVGGVASGVLCRVSHGRLGTARVGPVVVAAHHVEGGEGYVGELPSGILGVIPALTVEAEPLPALGLLIGEEHTAQEGQALPRSSVATVGPFVVPRGIDQWGGEPVEDLQGLVVDAIGAGPTTLDVAHVDGEGHPLGVDPLLETLELGVLVRPVTRIADQGELESFPATLVGLVLAAPGHEQPP